jgi:hypothetical protein
MDGGPHIAQKDSDYADLFYSRKKRFLYSQKLSLRNVKNHYLMITGTQDTSVKKQSCYLVVNLNNYWSFSDVKLMVKWFIEIIK